MVRGNRVIHDLPQELFVTLNRFWSQARRHAAAAPLGRELAMPLIDSFSYGNACQQRPKILTILQHWKAALIDGVKETMEGAQGHVLLILCTTR
jgi:hypothetical protein